MCALIGNTCSTHGSNFPCGKMWFLKILQDFAIIIFNKYLVDSHSIKYLLKWIIFFFQCEINFTQSQKHY